MLAAEKPAVKFQGRRHGWREARGVLRRVTLTNSGPRTVEIDVTSCAELALAPQAADSAHPAFSRLFVQTEFLAASGTLLATNDGCDADTARAAHVQCTQKHHNRARRAQGRRKGAASVPTPLARARTCPQLLAPR